MFSRLVVPCLSVSCSGGIGGVGRGYWVFGIFTGDLGIFVPSCCDLGSSLVVRFCSSFCGSTWSVYIWVMLFVSFWVLYSLVIFVCACWCRCHESVYCFSAISFVFFEFRPVFCIVLFVVLMRRSGVLLCVYNCYFVLFFVMW